MRRRAVLGVVLLAAVLITACLGQPQPAATPTAPAAQPTIPTAAPPATPQARPTVPLPSHTPTVMPTERAGPPSAAVAESINLGVAAGNAYFPQGVAVDPARKLAYVLSQQGDSGPGLAVISQVDLAAGRVRATAGITLTPGYQPDVLLSADGARLYLRGGAANQDLGLYVVASGAGPEGFGRQLARRPNVRGAAYDPATDSVYALAEETLLRLDGATLHERASAAAPSAPPVPPSILLTVNSTARLVYLSVPNYNSIQVYNAGDLSPAGQITTSARIKSLTSLAGQERTYALLESATGGDMQTQVAVLQGDRIVATWQNDADYAIGRVLGDPATGNVLLLEDGRGDRLQSSRMRALDAAGGQAQRTVALPYLTMGYAQGAFVLGDTLYHLAEVLTPLRLSDGRPGTPIYLGITLVSAALDGALNRLYVLDAAGAVHVIDSASFAEIESWPGVVDPGLAPLIQGPLTVAGDRLYVGDRRAGVVHVLDKTGGARLADIGRYGQVTADLKRNRLFVTDQGVQVVDATTYQSTGAISDTIRQYPQLVVPGAIEARYDEINDVLLVTMSNNSPGSSNSSWLQLYRGDSLERINVNLKPDRQFTQGVAAPEKGRLWVAGGFPSASLSLYTLGGDLVTRLSGVGGRLFMDRAAQRMYMLDWGGIVTVDTVSNEVIAYRPLQTNSANLAVYDARWRRFYLSGAPGAFLQRVEVQGNPPIRPQAPGPLPALPVRDLAVDAAGVPFASVDVSQQGSTRLYAQAGDAWRQVAALPSARLLQRVLAAPGAPGVLFTYSADQLSGGGILRTDDGGSTWRLKVEGLRDLRLQSLTLSPDFQKDGTALVLAGGTALYQTTDRGEAWSRLADVQGIRVALGGGGGRAFLLLATDPLRPEQTAIYRGAVGSTNLEQVATNPISSYYVGDLALSPNFAQDGKALLATSSHGGAAGGLLASTDGGRSWQQVGPAIDMALADYHIIFSPRFPTDRTVYVLAAPLYYQPGDRSFVLRSTDGGAHWEQGSADPRTSALAVGPDGRLWLGDTSGRVIAVAPATLTWQVAARQPTPAASPTPLPSLPPATPLPTPGAPAPTTPPAGLYAPSGPFAPVWLSNADVRALLGFATMPYAQQAAIAWQLFEFGRMVWWQDSRRIDVLFEDGTVQSFADAWQEGQPESDPAIVAPPGRYQPKRGFGKVWREQASVRSRLGWAVTEETGLAAPVQQFERGVLFGIGQAVYGLVFEDGRPHAYFVRERWLQ